MIEKPRSSTSYTAPMQRWCNMCAIKKCSRWFTSTANFVAAAAATACSACDTAHLACMHAVRRGGGCKRFNRVGRKPCLLVAICMLLLMGGKRLVLMHCIAMCVWFGTTASASWDISDRFHGLSALQLQPCLDFIPCTIIRFRWFRMAKLILLRMAIALGILPMLMLPHITSGIKPADIYLNGSIFKYCQVGKKHE